MMNRKTRSLRPEDRQAIDLLLDNAAARTGVVKIAAGVAQPRLTAAAKLLALLGRMPVEEPLAGLAARTMAVVDAQITSTTPAAVGVRSSAAFN